VKYAEAFETLGYILVSKRQDWSAEKSDGVCVTLWKRQLDWDRLSYDTRGYKGDDTTWISKSGNKKRIAHAQTALAEFDGWVDAILISGKPGVSYEDAQIWVPAYKGGARWRIVFLDEATGHIRLEAQ
jgi:hypothetical protein